MSRHHTHDSIRETVERMKVLGDRVLIEFDPISNRSEGGILLADNAADTAEVQGLAVVLAVGEGIEYLDTEADPAKLRRIGVPPGLFKGARVLCPRSAGQAIPGDPKPHRYRVVRACNIACVILPPDVVTELAESTKLAEAVDKLREPKKG